MALAPAHGFGQIIGDLLEEMMGQKFQDFCDQRGLYLDKKGTRGEARGGKKVSWRDRYGNSHDLDFVIEKGGSASVCGRPLAFIEVAWRRYTKHSRNKAQEIQGAILPIAEQYEWDKPFLGVILAGVFTKNSLIQMGTSGFEVALFPYASVVAAFESIGIDAAFDEDTPDELFTKAVDEIKSLTPDVRATLKRNLESSNEEVLGQFLDKLRTALDRRIEEIILIPLHGCQNTFDSVEEAIGFVNRYREDDVRDGTFRKYEILVRYCNGDKIEAFFQDKEKAVSFLHYIEGGAGA